MLLVTGAAGLSGSLIVQEFVRNNQPVRVLVRDRARMPQPSPLVEVVEGDMGRSDTLGPALNGIERVVLISSSNKAMVETQCTFIDAAKAAGVPHVIKLSGQESGITFNGDNFRFTRFHLEIERYLEASGVLWTQLRPSQFMQVYLREASTIAGKGALCIPMGNARLSPIDVEDIAKIAYGLLISGGYEWQRLEMTGPEALTMAEVAQYLSSAINKPVRYVAVSLAERRQQLLARGTPPEVIDAFEEQSVERMKCAESKVQTAVHALFGVRPTTFAEFAQRHAATFSGN